MMRVKISVVAIALLCTAFLGSVAAQVPGIFQPLLVGSSGVLSVSFTDNDAQNSSSTTYTFTGKSIGPVGPNRFIIVSLNQIGSAVAPTTVTIGGISATQLVSANNASSSSVSFWRAPVPTGTTANISVTLGSSTNRLAVGVWALYGGTGITFATASSAATNPGDVSLNVPAGGVAIAAAVSTSTVTYVGATERFDTSTNWGAGDFYSGADFTTLTSSTPQTITITRGSPSASFDVAASVSFSP